MKIAAKLLVMGLFGTFSYLTYAATTVMATTTVIGTHTVGAIEVTTVPQTMTDTRVFPNSDLTGARVTRTATNTKIFGDDITGFSAAPTGVPNNSGAGTNSGPGTAVRPNVPSSVPDGTKTQ